MIETTKKKLKDKAGFTLIELVVVIAVIGILASIAIPRVTGITANAEKQATKQHIAILNSALERYKAFTGDDDLSDLNSGADGAIKGTSSTETADAGIAIRGLKHEDYLNNDVSETKLPNKENVKLHKDGTDYYFKE